MGAERHRQYREKGESPRRPATCGEKVPALDRSRSARLIRAFPTRTRMPSNRSPAPSCRNSKTSSSARESPSIATHAGGAAAESARPSNRP